MYIKGKYVRSKKNVPRRDFRWLLRAPVTACEFPGQLGAGLEIALIGADEAQSEAPDANEYSD